MATIPLTARLGRLLKHVRDTRRPRTEAKASRTGPLMAVSTLGRAVWSPRDYASLAREGFMKNPVAFRAIRMISEAAASIPWLMYDGEREVSDHPLLDLLARPNPAVSGVELMEALYGHLLVGGNAYLEAVSVADRVRELFVLRPDRMRVVPGPDGWPQAFEYVTAGRTVRFDQAEPPIPPILHLSMFHPLNDHYGFAPLEAAQASLEIHNASAEWNKALLDNAARPSGALVYTGGDGNLSEDQFERLKRELEEGYQGASNAGRPLLLEGGLDWKMMALTPRDMDFIEAKNQAAREIALALGVPPMLLGIPGDNTYANFREAQRAFWRQTVIPLVNRTAQALTNWLAPTAGGALRLSVDLDAVEALSCERHALWERVGGATFLTDDEKRAAVGYGIGGPGAEDARTGTGPASAQRAGDPAGRPSGRGR